MSEPLNNCPHIIPLANASAISVGRELCPYCWKKEFESAHALLAKYAASNAALVEDQSDITIEGEFESMTLADALETIRQKPFGFETLKAREARRFFEGYVQGARGEREKEGTV